MFNDFSLYLDVLSAAEALAEGFAIGLSVWLITFLTFKVWSFFQQIIKG